MSFEPELYISPRTKEIEQIFLDNRPAIEADFADLSYTITDLARKWSVNHRNIVRWMKRCNICSEERNQHRREQGFLTRGRGGVVKNIQEDRVRNPKLLSMKW